MVKEIIQTDQAPEAIGPYSQGVLTQSDRLLFISGQIALDPKTGSFIDGDIKMQTKQVLENIRGVLEASGSGFDKVVKTTVFLKDITDFTEMNRVYETYFQEKFPARSTVEVSRLPKGARVEIECIAVIA